MQNVVSINIFQFGLAYLMLLVVLAIMKKCKINQTKLLIVASIRMTVQLLLTGFVLTYIFENPHPLFVVAYLTAMTTFAIHRVLSKNPDINRQFKIIVGFSLAGTGLAVVLFFVMVIIGINVFNPQYTIPLSGMIFGNAMTGLNLGLKSFNESVKSHKSQIDSLLNLGSTPKKILMPYVNSALETALLPTMNSMVGMGIVTLPGLMTGQIMAGVMPTTAILYQIAMMIAVCTVVCLAVFSSLFWGYKTLYNKRNQIII